MGKNRIKKPVFNKVRGVVYLAGPIRSRWRFERWLNVLRARKVAIRLWNAGFAVICPHLNSVTLRHRVNEEWIVIGDMSIVEKCDFMVVIGDWLNSRGSLGEFILAKRIHLKVFTNVDEAITYGCVREVHKE